MKVSLDEKIQGQLGAVSQMSTDREKVAILTKTYYMASRAVVPHGGGNK